MFLYKRNNKLNFWAKWARVVFLYFISFISKSIHRLRVLQLVLLKSVQNCQFKASNMWKVAWRMLTNCTFCTNFYLFCKESVAMINKIINPPNCLLSKNPPKSFEAGADHTLNPAFSSLILPQLSQQMVQPPEKKPHRNTHLHSISLLVNRHTQHTQLIHTDSSDPGDRKRKQERIRGERMGLCTGKERVKERSPLREWESDVTWQQTRQLVFAILTDNTERLWSQILPCAFNADFSDPVLYNSLCHCKLSQLWTPAASQIYSLTLKRRGKAAGVTITPLTVSSSDRSPHQT